MGIGQFRQWIAPREAVVEEPLPVQVADFRTGPRPPASGSLRPRRGRPVAPTGSAALVVAKGMSSGARFALSLGIGGGVLLLLIGVGVVIVLPNSRAGMNEATAGPQFFEDDLPPQGAAIITSSSGAAFRPRFGLAAGMAPTWSCAYSTPSPIKWWPTASVAAPIIAP